MSQYSRGWLYWPTAVLRRCKPQRGMRYITDTPPQTAAPSSCWPPARCYRTDLKLSMARSLFSTPCSRRQYNLYNLRPQGDRIPLMIRSPTSMTLFCFFSVIPSAMRPTAISIGPRGGRMPPASALGCPRCYRLTLAHTELHDHDLNAMQDNAILRNSPMKYWTLL